MGLTTSAASQLDELFALARWQQLADTEVCKRWWAHMSDLMLTNADNSPVSVELESVFHLD